MKTHASLTDIDLSNDESNQNKNRLGNAGFEAVMEAIIDSHTSVISMINIAQNNISHTIPETFQLLKVLLSVKGDQLISLNLSDNDLGPDFLSSLGPSSLCNLLELSLSNTRLNNKSMSDLADYLTEQRFSLVNLDLSSNAFTVEGYFRLLTALKQNQSSIKKLNLSKNNFGFEANEEVQPAYFAITEQFIS